MRKIKLSALAFVFAACTLAVPAAFYAEEADEYVEEEYAEDENAEEAEEDAEEEEGPSWFVINVSGFSLEGEEIDPWEYVGIVNDEVVDTGVLVHKDPEEDSEVTGSLLPGCGMKVVYRGDDWCEIKSGKVSGYVMNSYLLFGEDAKELAQSYGIDGVEANWNDVNVFENPDGDAWIADSVDEGETYAVLDDQGHWIAVKYSEEFTGYISEEDFHRVLLLPTAVTNDGELSAEDEEEAEEEEYKEEEYYEEPANNNYNNNNNYTDNTNYNNYTEPANTTPATEAPAVQPETQAPATEAPAAEPAPAADDTAEEEAGETYYEDNETGYDDVEDDDVEDVDDAEEYFEDFA